ncbi:hypothetical protein DBR11_04720 [Pedobacter sp. HMWF019]|uniref:hypothetical protein n=1 Tax=Pedobacter sp. HMWF019 TaxID=2056856 RepID=UPI000D332F9D|nr:hypothetical protein [Pedobacter sp. HMWF019]PTT02455.1 hypothetical protein DBR11_04720 [Pedobacter sp. HMWF019]
MDIFSLFHKTNIVIHVLAGSSALLIGLFILFAAKGGKRHRSSGRLFLWLLSIVILTGLLGVFIFKRNSFLPVITLLSGYLGFSGFRVMRNRINKPRLLDVAAAVLSILSVFFFVYYFKSIGMIWSPVIIYSTVGYLVLVVVYDLGRYLLSKKTYQHMWMYEHILKMVSAFTALLSAFTGTVLPQYHPYSQFLPSVFGTVVALGFMLVYWYKRKV